MMINIIVVDVPDNEKDSNVSDFDRDYNSMATRLIIKRAVQRTNILRLAIPSR